MKPMLAGKFIPEKIEKLLPVYGQPKFDGIRMFVRDGIAWTRSNKPVRSEQVQSLIANSRNINEGKDGELIVGDPTAPDCYRRTMSSVMSYNKPDPELKLYVFDQWDLPDIFEQRLKYLEDEKHNWPDFMKLSDIELFYSLVEVQEYEARMLSLGHEGIILRNPISYYKYGRGSPTQGECIKVKQFLDTEAVITEVHELLHNSNEAIKDDWGMTTHTGHKEGLVPMNTLGAFSAEGKWPDGTAYTVRIGTGFNAAQRDEYWKSSTMVGRIVKFKYFEGGVKEAPRFPVFLGFRDTEDMEKQGELF